jgi:hypothetical protein
MEIPYAPSAANPGRGFDGKYGSWLKALEWRHSVLASLVQPDGSMPSPGHGGREPVFAICMVIDECFEFCRTVRWDPVIFATGLRALTHLMDALGPTQQCLPYLLGDAQTAPDLACYPVVVALEAWQETGDDRYRDFALKSFAASKTAFITGDSDKQWNQKYGYPRAWKAKALAGGKPWR